MSGWCSGSVLMLGMRSKSFSSSSSPLLVAFDVLYSFLRHGGTPYSTVDGRATSRTAQVRVRDLKVTLCRFSFFCDPKPSVVIR